MMLRSASTPSLVSSFMERPAGAGVSPHRTSSQVSCNIGHAPGFAEIRSRRAQSAGNLEEILFNIAFHAGGDAATLSRQSSKRINALEAIPSFHSSDDGAAEAEEEEDEYEYEYAGGVRGLNGFCDVGFPGEGKMYLAAGIGVNAVAFLEEAGFGGGGGGYNRTADGYRDGGDNRGRGLSVENHFKNMLLQWPGNPLVLRNYAHFLYQRKGDLLGAEEYYSRAILADPEDGETLCEYGKLIWELHRDTERAKSYFERAIMASSTQNCNVSASYASFLWDLDDEDEDAAAQSQTNPPPTPLLLQC
ncbi:uncharacterized protein LOC131009013 [Salvia miltiorrhiza]|uniref:uncharacterized protein LOC131009013 n=1 Tax=Salvia miltiorrhiza TaxID=226208 RepID=UPI0025AD9B66|nr:uncharacterized protein LOC131009013 [Salvia miltiorrhiza]